jgi:Pvc16 N-terminal domain
MIQDVDDTLRHVILSDALKKGSGAQLAFDAPTKDWAARRSSPTVDLYLYDIREDTERRHAGYGRVLEQSGRVIDRRPAPRRFALSYLITAWTKRPEDEHRLLSLVLACFLRFEELPHESLQGTLADQPFPVLVRVAVPPADERSISDLWTALGGELKPSLDLVVIAPFDTGRIAKVGPPVLEEPRLVLGADGKGKETRKSRRRAKRGSRPAAREDEAAAEKPDEAEAEDTVRGGT